MWVSEYKNVEWCVLETTHSHGSQAFSRRSFKLYPWLGHDIAQQVAVSKFSFRLPLDLLGPALLAVPDGHDITIAKRVQNSQKFLDVQGAQPRILSGFEGD